jgi:hypothetical protein
LAAGLGGLRESNHDDHGVLDQQHPAALTTAECAACENARPAIVQALTVKRLDSHVIVVCTAKG